MSVQRHLRSSLVERRLRDRRRALVLIATTVS